MMISYAQNFEDVLLERVFKDQQEGFWIDVGAWEDTFDSVTKHFYNKGWRGINIEPVPYYWQKLEQGRPRDINLNIALLDKAGTSSFYELPGTGLSTFDQQQAENYRIQGQDIRERAVEVSTLALICAQHAEHLTIDFLKLDTEGTELKVLQGGDWGRFRPRIVIIEATQPCSPAPTHQEWEPFLLDQGYLLAYFDGLNRFYVRAEEAYAIEHFTIPVNVYDEFMLYRTAAAEERATQLEKRLGSALRKADEYDRARHRLIGKALLRAL